MLALFVIDSANLNLLQNWMASGDLPNLAALWRNSRRGPVGGDLYFDEIGTMCTAYSGIPVTQHGYYSARYLHPGTYDLRIQPLTDIPAPPFWATLPQNQFRSLILEPIESFPIPSLNGDQLYNLTVHQEAYAKAPFVAQPASLREHVAKFFPQPPELDFSSFNAPLGWYQQQLQHYLEVLQQKTRLFASLLRSASYDVAVIGFNEFHDCGHVLWQFFENRSPERDPKGLLADGLKSIYVAVDRAIGELLSILPAGASVALLSAYGLKDQYPTLELAERLMTKAGFTVPQKPRLSSWQALARRIIPEPLRFAISKSLPSSTQQSLVASAFASQINWAKTTAVVLPVSLFSSQIRVNLKGREPNGIVEPGAPLLQLLDEIESTFRALIDPVTGQPAVAAVLRPPMPNFLLPDLYIHYRSARHFLATTHHPRWGTLTQRPPAFFRNSYHSRPGLLAISDPQFSPGDFSAEVPLEQIAPLLTSTLCAS